MKHGNISKDLRQLILKGGQSDEEILAEVHKIHPGCSTTLLSVFNTRSKLRREGAELPEHWIR